MCMQVPVAEGASTSLKGLTKEHIADFVHGTDGFGNTSQAAVEVRRRADDMDPAGPDCSSVSSETLFCGSV